MSATVLIRRMIGTLTYKRLVLWTLCLFLAATASAAPTLYELVGVQFNDGGTATGSFVFDPSTGLFSAVNITTTAGALRTGAAYHFVCGQDVPTCTGVAPNSLQILNLTTTAGNQIGNPGFAIFFAGVGSTQGLGTAATFDISNNSAAVGAAQEANCADAVCTFPGAAARVTVAGFVVARPTMTVDNTYQVRYAANLDVGESYIDIINTGFNGVPLLGPGVNAGNFGNALGLGNICVNLYALAADEQLDACCSCLVTPDQVVSLGVRSSLLVKTLTGAPVTSETIKIIGSTPVNNSCNNSAAMVTAANLVGGYVAFGTTLHVTPTPGSYVTTEAPFLPVQFLTTAGAGANDDLHSLVGRCASILGNGSGSGICGGCNPGALGATRK